MFYACEVWCIADISSVSPSSAPITLETSAKHQTNVEQTGFFSKQISGVQEIDAPSQARHIFCLFVLSILAKCIPHFRPNWRETYPYCHFRGSSTLPRILRKWASRMFGVLLTAGSVFKSDVIQADITSIAGASHTLEHDLPR